MAVCIHEGDLLATMTFDLDDFAQHPSSDKLDQCTKADLLLVANLFNVVVPMNARKAEMKYSLSEQLVEGV